MADVDERLAGLSADRRRLLQRLRESRDAGALPLPEAARIDAERFQFDGAMQRDQGQVQRFYDAVSRQLDAGPFADHARFLNYGYVPNDNRQHARWRPPAGQPGRNAVRLVLELIGDVDIGAAHAVLDVGCGRGGTVALLREHCGPRLVVGLDLAPAAVAFCRRTQSGPGVHFLTGSAEALPVATGSVDCVTNVESSHCYGRIHDFLTEVHRVLRDGGSFLYTDVIAREDVMPREDFLESLGFSREFVQDITSNVLLSCDETAAAHVRAFHHENDRSLIDSFLGVPSSALYEAMKDGRQRYLMYRWRKSNAGS